MDHAIHSRARKRFTLPCDKGEQVEEESENWKINQVCASSNHIHYKLLSLAAQTVVHDDKEKRGQRRKLGFCMGIYQ